MTPAAVLDTNVVLDWLVFHDPSTALLAHQLAAGRLAWRATAAMRTEFEQVLARPALADWQPDPLAARTAWDTHAQLDAEPPPGPLVCLDADDQIFIDLAIAGRCRWLLSRDRALLRLAKRARVFGVDVLTPQAWSMQNEMFAPTAVSIPA